MAWAMLVEAGLTIAVVAALLPLFAPLAARDSGRDGRFADAAVAVQGLPEPVLPQLCAAFAARAEPVVGERLCGKSALRALLDLIPFVSSRGSARPVALAPIDRLPGALVEAKTRAREAFLAPLANATASLADLRRQQREGLGDLLQLGDAIAAAQADIQPYLARFRIDGDALDGPVPLACALAQVQAALAEGAPAPGSEGDIARANTLLLLGAAFDGSSATPGLVNVALLARGRAALRRGCAGFELPEALAGSAALMSDARAAPFATAKNEAMRELLRTAGWQWAAWALAGLALLQLSRRAGAAAPGIALALASFAAAAWVARVAWPLSGHGLVLGRVSASYLAMPAGFVWVLLGCALAVLVCTPWLSRLLTTGSQKIASVFGYPALVGATGLGSVIILDLSANGYAGNRYLALYHQGHLWLAMLVFTLVAFLRQPLARALSWTLSRASAIARGVHERVGAAGGATLVLAVMLILLAIIGSVLANLRQLTSELGRLWLIVGAAWFFFLRGTPLTQRIARSGNSLGSLIRYVWPLLFVVAVLIGAMFVTHDMGPLLIAGYGAGAFVAASVATWWYQRRNTLTVASLLAVILFVAWILAITGALFRFGSYDEVAAARLENLAAPLASANDQLALVTWFQRAAPETGYGPGAVPWCGFGATNACAGVPAQIQSDYTFTALVGEFGWKGAWAITLGWVLWLYVLIWRHGRVTRGEPRLVMRAGRMCNDDQAYVSWLAVMWAVLALCQLAVTVAGNLAVIPLTGVTFPFVSFGMTSLLANMAMLGLAINVNDD